MTEINDIKNADDFAEWVMQVKDCTTEQMKAAADASGMTQEQIVNLLSEKVEFFKQRSERIRKTADSLERAQAVICAMKSLKHQSPKEVMDHIERTFPTIFRLSYPRSFQIPNGFCNPKRFCIVAFDALWHCSRWNIEMFHKEIRDSMEIQEESLQESRASLPIVHSMIDMEVPTYFVSRNIMQSLINTDLPKDFQVQEMPWPLDAMLFVIPESALQSPDGDVKFLAVAKIAAGKRMTCPWLRWDNGDFSDYILNPDETFDGPDSVALLAMTDTGKLFEWSCPINATSIHDATQTKAFSIDLTVDKRADGMTSEEDEQFASSNLPRAAFQIILAMLAAPEMIEAGVVCRQASEKKGKRQCAIWHPNFFGKAYRRYDEVIGESGTGSKRRVHWRRGHFRHQRIGAGLKAIRVLWIQPCLIGKQQLAA